MAGPDAGWTCGSTLQVGGGLAVSFQRYPRPADGIVPDLPRSLGALPVAGGPAGAWLVPLADGEAFWLGLSVDAAAAPIFLACAVAPVQGPPIDVMTGASWDPLKPGPIALPQSRWLDGIARADGRRTAFMRARHGRDGQGWSGLQLYGAAASADAAGEGSAPVGPFRLLAAVRFVTYADFSAQSGCAAPAGLNADDAYQGWRLP